MIACVNKHSQRSRKYVREGDTNAHMHSRHHHPTTDIDITLNIVTSIDIANPDVHICAQCAQAPTAPDC